MIHNYRQIGSSVPLGEAQVTIDDVEPLRIIATVGLLEVVQNREQSFRQEYNATDSKIAYALRFDSPDEFEYDARCIYLGVRVASEVITDSWQMAIGIRTQNGANKESSKYVKYSCEAIGSEIWSAKKEAYLLRSHCTEVIDTDGDVYRQVNSERKMYERSLNPDDCMYLQIVLERATKRAAVM